MNIPIPLPDECSRGYLGRINKLNGDLHLHNLHRMLFNVASESGAPFDRKDWTNSLAVVSGLGNVNFIRRHTFLPFSRAIHTESAGIAHGIRYPGSQWRMVKMTPLTKFARFCKECIRADRASTGVDYWRRSHQFPGAVFCSEHGSPLYQMDRYAPERGMPADFENVAMAVNKKIVLAAKKNPLVARYIRVCQQLLDGIHPIDTRQASFRIAERAAHFNLRRSMYDGKKNLSDQIIFHLAGAWLEEFFPYLTGKQPGAFIPRFDGICAQTKALFPVTAYALALTVLWDSPEEAVESFRRPINPLAIKKCLKKYGHASVNTKLAIQLLGGGNERKTPQNAVAAIELFSSGWSITEASEQSGLLPLELEEVLRNVLAVLRS